jgi:hypothetical protein
MGNNPHSSISSPSGWRVQAPRWSPLRHLPSGAQLAEPSPYSDAAMRLHMERLRWIEAEGEIQGYESRVMVLKHRFRTPGGGLTVTIDTCDALGSAASSGAPSTNTLARLSECAGARRGGYRQRENGVANVIAERAAALGRL